MVVIVGNRRHCDADGKMTNSMVVLGKVIGTLTRLLVKPSMGDEIEMSV